MLSLSDRKRPKWAIVKGISDFADNKRHEEVEAARTLACYNAASFALAAIHNSDQVLE